MRNFIALFRSSLPWLVWLLAPTVSSNIGCVNAPAPRTAQAGKTSPASRPAVRGIENFSKVSDSLYRGAQPTEAGYETLGNLGVHTIVTLRVLDHDSDELRQAGFQTYHISFKHVHPESEDVLKFLTIVTDKRNQPVFVHCREGEDRTGMMVAVYRMVVQNWPRDQAIREMKEMGFHRKWNKPIVRYLRHMDVGKIKQQLARNVDLSRDGMNGME